MAFVAMLPVLYHVKQYTKPHVFWYIPLAQHHFKVNPVLKRGSMLSRLIENSKVTTDWKEAPTNYHGKGIFAKVSRPTRRRTVLNNLFIENITEVLSTGAVAPEILGHGIEISGVKISYDFTILHVFWSVPLSKTSAVTDIEGILAKRAPQIRAELISRNVLGKVPHIYFIRDTTNSMLASFEQALASADLGPKDQRNIMPDTAFLKDITKFTENKAIANLLRQKENEEALALKQKKTQSEKEQGTILEVKSEMKTEEKKETESEENKEVVSAEMLDKSSAIMPVLAEQVTTGIPDLDYYKLMNKVMQSKKKKSPTNVLLSSENDDLFSKIEGVSLEQNAIDHEEVLKKFRVERKAKMQRMKSLYQGKIEDDDALEEINVLDCQPEKDCNFEKDEFVEIDVERIDDIKVSEP